MYEKHNDYDVTIESYESVNKKLDYLKAEISKKKIFLGLDGYVDSLYSLANKRTSVSDWERMDSMKIFGERVLNVAGSSANIERVLKRKISGGFAPNTCRAINGVGMDVTLMAATGYPIVDEIFKPLTDRDTINSISFSNPGETAGLEFDDGKVMLTDFANIFSISWDLLLERVGFDQFTNELEKADTMGFGHWSLIMEFDDIWHHLKDEVFPKIKNIRDKLFFVDLSDIKKRSKDDIVNMTKLLHEINAIVPVMLSLNDQEAIDISKALDNVEIIDPKKSGHQDYIEGGKLLNEEIGLSYLVVHSPHFATITTDKDHFWVTEGFTTKPQFTTGAGDHFHSGVAVGLTCGLTPPEALIIGNSLTAIFVRTGNSPNFEELSRFINQYMDYIVNDNPDFK